MAKTYPCPECGGLNNHQANCPEGSVVGDSPAYNEGLAAFCAGIETNPYEPDSPESIDWELGYQDCREEMEREESLDFGEPLEAGLRTIFDEQDTDIDEDDVPTDDIVLPPEMGGES